MTEPTMPQPVPGALFNAVGSALSQVFTAMGLPRPYFSQRRAVAVAIWSAIHNRPIPDNEPAIERSFGRKDGVSTYGQSAGSARAVAMIDVWLRDESQHDGVRQQLVWKHLREIRAALVDDGVTT